MTLFAKVFFVTDRYLWRFEGRKLQNKVVNLNWKYGDAIWGTAKSTDDIHENKYWQYCPCKNHFAGHCPKIMYFGT